MNTFRSPISEVTCQNYPTALLSLSSSTKKIVNFSPKLIIKPVISSEEAQALNIRKNLLHNTLSREAAHNSLWTARAWVHPEWEREGNVWQCPVPALGLSCAQPNHRERGKTCKIEVFMEDKQMQTRWHCLGVDSGCGRNLLRSEEISLKQGEELFGAAWTWIVNNALVRTDSPRDEEAQSCFQWSSVTALIST